MFELFSSKTQIMHKRSVISLTLISFIYLVILSFKILVKPPQDFVYIQNHIPDIILDIRYARSDNFVGQPVDGYLKPVAILSLEATTALQKVQAELKQQNLGLKVFDAYRPQKAVDHFARWAKILDDTLTKQKYYPKVKKSDLFQHKYITSKSGHSRGSTVDLTLVDTEGNELDMGTSWDYFGPESWPSSTAVSQIAQKNRKTLQDVMMKYNFKPYNEEWWHFTLGNEPYPNTYFNFNIE